MLEMDVCLTKDKQIVVLHDPVFDRLTGIKEHISKFNYSEIPPHLPEFELHFAEKKNRIFESKRTKDPYFPLLEVDIDIYIYISQMKTYIYLSIFHRKYSKNFPICLSM